MVQVCTCRDLRHFSYEIVNYIKIYSKYWVIGHNYVLVSFCIVWPTFACVGNEAHLSFCPNGTTHSTSKCTTHSSDASILCSTGKYNLLIISKSILCYYFAYWLNEVPIFFNV